jgi:NTP pyrophosphatase (non-canonical NTP hydrolase)
MSYLNELSKEIYSQNVKKGFWDKPREVGTILMLINSELVEALEADRKSRHFELKTKPIVNNISDFKSAFETHVKDTFEDEIADTIIRLLDLCGAAKIDIDWHIEQKLKYNQLRLHKHGKEY